MQIKMVTGLPRAGGIALLSKLISTPSQAGDVGEYEPELSLSSRAETKTALKKVADIHVM